MQKALLAKAALWDGAALFQFELLGLKALYDRAGLGVMWWEHADGGGRRLTANSDDEWAVAEWLMERVLSGVERDGIDG